MDWEIVEKFMRKYAVSAETALYYFALLEEGCTPEQARLWAGIADHL